VPWGCKVGKSKVSVITAYDEKSNSRYFYFQKPMPRISGLSSSSESIGSEVTIAGKNFGEDDGNGSVYFGKIAAEILDWSNESITVVVPGMKVGIKGEKSVVVKVNTIYGYSNGKMFKVKK